MNYLNELLFGLYPYVAGTIFLAGSLLRFDHGQYTWKTGSSQMLSKRQMRLASNLFHIGILVIFFGHLVGLLTPHWVYAPFISAGSKQIIAIIVGGIAGLMCLTGGAMLLHRRLTNPRVRATSSRADIVILALLVAQVSLGLLTIIPAMGHLDGGAMLELAEWAQSIVFFKGGAAEHLAEIGLVYKLHILLGLTIVLVFPFTRLVHVWSAPLGYIGRRYQIVRRKA
ncbi:MULTISPECIES: respiratory nitrate reductase subunit gamma [Chromohalobacter]|uniref:nitrate reductase (quinone) n=2 Tax=Chromohalobacter TaxID=42054 RepID=A0A9X2X0N7_9GAMM|nr:MULTISPECIES: respiratory nitrate reductase subunit gamma [Chromohalobacter]NWO10799.1 respiratory nitrate reductase subunit gamma [Chromohalobacter salexigens]MCK2042700.1 respiratory nitrate reductase subunit gamma [Chromohalobacter moromii]MCK2045399.1 respiratory nitrate reductase subunit gamma [Chromohalobacter moromii]MCT8468547.1 respiratory nitrate reductase subunit gamma [Chromohalobacter canadensis]MCT8471602.1 respiratory nitrate reductase subunit gamma [Chromohalobacter canadens